MRAHLRAVGSGTVTGRSTGVTHVTTVAGRPHALCCVSPSRACMPNVPLPHLPPYLHEAHGAATVQAIETYRGNVARDERGAVLLAVCQGRVSEGIDFSDDEGRTVVVAGIPFPPAKDARVLCKKQVVDDRRRRGQGTLTGTATCTCCASYASYACVLPPSIPPLCAGDVPSMGFGVACLLPAWLVSDCALCQRATAFCCLGFADSPAVACYG